jgi:hypothetical protein
MWSAMATLDITTARPDMAVDRGVEGLSRMSSGESVIDGELDMTDILV